MAPTSARAGPAPYPFRLGLVSDVGQTFNSSTTMEHLLVRAQAAIQQTAGVQSIVRPCSGQGPHRGCFPLHWFGTPLLTASEPSHHKRRLRARNAAAWSMV